jgi:uncharacterized protein YehS (DUF1456 family)
MFSKKVIYSFLLSLFFLSFSANSADLNEILKSGEVKIAVPESFAPFRSVGNQANTKVMMLMLQNL